MDISAPNDWHDGLLLFRDERTNGLDDVPAGFPQVRQPRRRRLRLAVGYIEQKVYPGRGE